MLVGTIAMICAFIQAILMLFRDGSVLILAGSTALAASGSFTSATNGWLPTLIKWQLALIFYKPAASLVYATAIWLQGENTATDPRVLLMGIAMMAVALVALPVLLRFFNWTVGGLHSGGGGGLGMLATAGAAGMHAAASLRGGGFGVNEHARYLNETFDRGSSPGPGQGPTSPGNRPGPGPGSGPGPVPSPGSKPPTFVGEAGGGRVATVTSAGSSTAGAGAASGASGAAAGSGAAVGAGTGAAVGASAATGPAAPVVAGAVVVTSAVAQTAKAAAHTAANATSDAAKGR
jgi:hypothetical protein